MKSVPSKSTHQPDHYDEFLGYLKQQIQRAQITAATALNRELILLYWTIGQEILTRQAAEGWGTKVIDRLATDLHSAFPQIQGFSARNLKYMRAFAEAYPDREIVQQVLHNLPWGHLVRLLDRVKDPKARLWYAKSTIEQGWSRNILSHQIDSQLYDRQGNAITNFEQTLPKPQSDLAQQLIKDPYHFDVRHGTWTAFLTQSGGYVEGGT
jgi:predicted nuclease of restriction endonuclease-like (RecB) superfamily